jgi:hypothetical protein
VGVLEDGDHSPLPCGQVSVALEAGTSSGVDRAVLQDLITTTLRSLDTTVNVIKELGLSQFDDEAPFTPTQPKLP